VRVSKELHHRERCGGEGKRSFVEVDVPRLDDAFARRKRHVPETVHLARLVESDHHGANDDGIELETLLLTRFLDEGLAVEGAKMLERRGRSVPAMERSVAVDGGVSTAVVDVDNELDSLSPPAMVDVGLVDDRANGFDEGTVDVFRSSVVLRRVGNGEVVVDSVVAEEGLEVVGEVLATVVGVEDLELLARSSFGDGEPVFELGEGVAVVSPGESSETGAAPRGRKVGSEEVELDRAVTGQAGTCQKDRPFPKKIASAALGTGTGTAHGRYLPPDRYFWAVPVRIGGGSCILLHGTSMDIARGLWSCTIVQHILPAFKHGKKLILGKLTIWAAGPWAKLSKSAPGAKLSKSSPASRSVVCR